MLCCVVVLVFTQLVTITEPTQPLFCRGFWVCPLMTTTHCMCFELDTVLGAISFYALCMLYVHCQTDEFELSLCAKNELGFASQ